MALTTSGPTTTREGFELERKAGWCVERKAEGVDERKALTRGWR